METTLHRSTEPSRRAGAEGRFAAKISVRAVLRTVKRAEGRYTIVRRTSNHQRFL